MRNNELTLFGDPFFGEPFDLMFNKLFNVFPVTDFNKSMNNGFVEHDDNYSLDITLPIVGDSLKIEVENGSLEVSYDEKTENGYHKGSYKFSLPDDVDETAIKAELGTLADNRLVVTAPKKVLPPVKGPRQIDVTVK